MRARITLAVVGILVLALGLAGVGSLLLVRNAARDSAVRTTLREAEALASASGRSKFLKQLESNPDPTDFAAVVDLVGQVAGFENASVVVVSNDKLLGAPPRGLSIAQLDPAGLAAGRSASGSVGSSAYAAVTLARLPTSATGGVPIAIALVLESPITTSADSAWYFALAAGVALVVSAAGATVITRRISRHVVAAADAAQAIASGDLDARVEGSGRNYPELVALGTSINTMAEGLGRARQLERQFLLSISHDLRTPLTSIRGYAEAIADGAVPDVGRAASVVVAEAARLERLIRDLLDLAYLDARRFSLRPEALDLSAVVHQAVEALSYEAEAAGLALGVDTGARPVAIVADGDRLAQIVANLVSNALKYAAGEILVSARVVAHSGGYVAELSVADDGPGIAAEDLPHIFERLYTSDRRPSRAARGTGLGLAIVAELTEAMGGTVAAESPTGPGGGTRVTLRLPVVVTDGAGAPGTPGAAMS